jgi:8-oxo-dGTP pyrophosphatase MutT (NUDIX family)
MTDFAIVHVTYRPPNPIFREYDHLVMIRKNRPHWQAGKLNMPGGHIEPDEAPVKTAARELFEETGMLAKHMPEMGIIYAGCHTIWVFRAVGISGKPTTKTDEPVELIPSHEIGERGGLVDQNIVLMHGLITNGVSGWSLYQTEHGYELKVPYLHP